MGVEELRLKDLSLPLRLNYSLQTPNLNPSTPMAYLYSMEKIAWRVEGMDCNTCALHIHKFLEKKGMQGVQVNYATGNVSFDNPGSQSENTLVKGIQDLGYEVVEHRREKIRKPWFKSHLQRFWFCFPFTAVLMSHMIPGIHLHFLMNHWVQLAITLPVYIVGMGYFGRSAWKSIRNAMPNMNVLITIGATAAFVYSLYGSLTGQPEKYLFYETAATILTLVFLGNYLEEASIGSTQRELNKLVKSQKVMATMIAFDDQHQEQLFQIENTALHVGDLILIKSGEQVPIDCKVLWGDVHVNEAILTGESAPIHKQKKDGLIGGSLITDGTVKAQVTAVGADTVLAGIIQLVKQAQGEKPPIQQLADRISAVFIPVVLGIAALTFTLTWILKGEFSQALLNSIAVLVIACPCAMGLATPAAIAVGLGRAARNGILFRNATSLELFKSIRRVVFDKTGTLTTGKFEIAQFKVEGDEKVEEVEFKRIAYSLEKYSNHPIAVCIQQQWKSADEIRWKQIEEVKGLGMKATDAEGRTYIAGSYKAAAELTTEVDHNVYILRDGKLLGWIDVKDEIRPEAKSVIEHLHGRGIKTVLLSGDRRSKCESLAKELGIDTVIAEQSPEQKLEKIGAWSAEKPTAMVGDGINDAPALAKATIGISLNDASQIAMQTAQVVLMNQGLKNLPLALGLGRHTFLTIQQNLFWAFAYNAALIPIAAGVLYPVNGLLLSPMLGAGAMALSSVFVLSNALRLRFYTPVTFGNDKT